MTREEAKKKIYEQWQEFLENNIDYAGISEAYKMAIKALEQEPCEDAISRQAALECCRNEWEEEVKIRLKSLPSVNPQQKYEDIAKAFQFGLAFGFGKKYDEMDKVMEGVKKVITPQKNIQEVLDKVRAKIEQIEINGYIRDIECFRAGINTALNVIDKYKAESEDNDLLEKVKGEQEE